MKEIQENIFMLHAPYIVKVIIVGEMLFWASSVYLDTNNIHSVWDILVTPRWVRPFIENQNSDLGIPTHKLKDNPSKGEGRPAIHKELLVGREGGEQFLNL